MTPFYYKGILFKDIQVALEYTKPIDRLNSIVYETRHQTNFKRMDDTGLDYSIRSAVVLTPRYLNEDMDIEL